MNGEDRMQAWLLRRADRAWTRFERTGNDADLVAAVNADRLYRRIRDSA